ncbi:unnamed protein product [Haemonchus placei]|uniref:GLOBIN domain-containing protein n=1 Tax=Haemonchus placei TaxID=6290 RepID=A0A0N4WUW0_HAEPC|nr:unnamed protein product [Haemonchus placei]
MPRNHAGAAALYKGDPPTEALNEDLPQLRLVDYYRRLLVGFKESTKLRYLNQNPENASLYAKLKSIDASTVDPTCSNPGFEAVAGNYLKVFDDIISAVEEKPGDVKQACDRLMAVGKMHRTKVTPPFQRQYSSRLIVAIS